MRLRAELADRLRLDLPKTLARALPLGSDLLQRPRLLDADAEPLADELALAFHERTQHLVHEREHVLIPDRHDFGASLGEHPPHEHLAQMLVRLRSHLFSRMDRHEHVMPPEFGGGERPQLRTARIAYRNPENGAEQVRVTIPIVRIDGNCELPDRELETVEHREDQILAEPRCERLTHRVLFFRHALLVVLEDHHDLGIATNHHAEHVALLGTIRKCF